MKKIFLSLLAIALIVCCIGCGNSSNEIVCSSCGESFSKTAKFCPNCGESAKNSSSNNEGNTSNNGNKNENGTTVNSSKELLNAIGDNKKVVLNGGKYNLYGINGIDNSKVEKDTSEFSNDGYIVSNVSNFEISGEGTFVVLSGDETWATGLNFTNCKNITISNVDFTTLNNSEEDWTQLLIFNDCENITIKNCTFSNCDTPIYFANTKSVSVEDVSIENTYALYSEFSTVSFENCNSSKFDIFCLASESTLKFENCNIKNSNGSTWSYIIEDTMHWSGESNDSNIEFFNSTISNNAISAIFAKTSGYGNSYTHNGIKFTNCTFSNNIYCNGELSGSNYVNCSFNNNSIGIEIPDMTEWSYDEESISQIGNELNGINYSIEYVYDKDLTSSVVTPTFSIVSQSKVGIVPKSNNNLVLTIAKPAITIEYIDWDINSVGGVEPDVKFQNNADKQIAYVYFTVKYYDRMGTPAYCSIQSICEQRWKVTGPINAGSTKTTGWEPTIYNSTVGAIKPLSIEIIFTDGTKQVITNTGGYWYSGSYYGGELKD